VVAAAHNKDATHSVPSEAFLHSIEGLSSHKHHSSLSATDHMSSLLDGRGLLPTGNHGKKHMLCLAQASLADIANFVVGRTADTFVASGCLTVVLCISNSQPAVVAQ
jgi:hypothetical protein